MMTDYLILTQCLIFIKISWLERFGKKDVCGNSSVGRARPCQGRGRESESRFPLRLKQTFIYWCILSGNSSVGRARPCQGRGRESESRFPLIVMPRWWNGRHVGLKIQWPLRSCGFKSRPGYYKTV